MLGVDSTEYCGDSAVARRFLLVQFIDGSGRPCDHAETWFAFSSWKVVDMPVVFNDRCLGLTVQNTVEIPQLHVDFCWCSSSTVLDVPVLMQRRVTGPSCCNDKVLGPDSAEHCLEVYRCSSASQRQGSQCKLYRRPEIPWCSFGMVVDMRVGVPTTGTGYGSDSTENCGVLQRRRT